MGEHIDTDDPDVEARQEPVEIKFGDVFKAILKDGSTGDSYVVTEIMEDYSAMAAAKIIDEESKRLRLLGTYTGMIQPTGDRWSLQDIVDGVFDSGEFDEDTKQRVSKVIEKNSHKPPIQYVGRRFKYES
jgi:hypothetical protein